MSREELKDIVVQVIRQLEDEEREAPTPACLFTDNPCDATTKYNIGEEG